MNLIKKVYVTLREVASHPLRRKSALNTCVDYVVAQVSSRFVPGDICVPFPNQTRLLIPPRMKGAAHFIIPGLSEFPEMSFAMHFLRPADLFVDVGANIGAYTVLASGVVGCRSVAFEPGSLAQRYLFQNVRLNNLQEKVTVRPEALGAKPGKVTLTEGLGTENFVLVGGNSGQVEVPLTTLDLGLEGLEPTLIKVDVEGFETEVFAGAEKTLALPGLAGMIIERMGNATRYGSNENALHERIQQAGFRPCAYRPLERVLDTLPPNALGNLIYVRDLEAARQRVRQAPSFQFTGRQI